MPFTVRAPASSANLGPGFDTLAVALDVWNEIDVDLAEDQDQILLGGSDAALLDGRENLTLKAMRSLAQRHGRELPPVSLTVRAEVPVARGLGSSAAAIAAGLLAVDCLLDLRLSRADLFAHAWSMEGHGDNVGAALYGGVVLSVPGLPEVIQLSNGRDLGLVTVLFIPEATGATWAARAALPSTIPHPDAAFTVATAAGLAVGLLTGNYAAIAAGMHDRLHEPYRARLFPHLTPMVDAAREAGAIGAALSGAGPSILALAEPDIAAEVERAYARTAERIGVPGRTAVLDLVCHGAQIVEEAGWPSVGGLRRRRS
jgi:homoserine kinase